MSFVNLAAYQFAALREIVPLREELRELTRMLKLRGTILLSPEGINLFVAGTRAAVDHLLARLRQIPGLSELQGKESLSDTQPFNRMLVKIKREIIAFGVPGIAPASYTSRRLPPKEFKQWLDQGREVVILDTRNNYEFEVGTFADAVPINIDDFRDFPAALRRLPDDFRQRPMVTFCTGGIRCEKAAPLLEREGFRDVYQLDGGILKYFEECGGAHYRGDCFVFDQRVALNPQLQPVDLAQCFACQAVLSVEDRQSARFVPGESCPHCYRTPEQRHQDLLARRQRDLARLTDPLPGSVPYDNLRPLSVPARLDGCELLDFLAALQTPLGRDEWAAICARGQLTCRDEVLLPGRKLRAGERIWHHLPATTEPPVSAAVRFLFEDDAIVVVNKPASLPVHPCGRFNRNTLIYWLNEIYRPWVLRPVHRLDADTSGVMVLAKTRGVARRLQQSFEQREVTKHYLVRVQGRPNWQATVCELPINLNLGPGGIRLPDPNGAAAETRFTVQANLPDGTTLLVAEPLTGRTNQIRAHLWALGLPVVGDPIYLPDGKLGTLQASPPTAAGLCLHAARLEFSHPLSNERLTVEAPSPDWI